MLRVDRNITILRMSVQLLNLNLSPSSSRTIGAVGWPLKVEMWR